MKNAKDMAAAQVLIVFFTLIAMYLYHAHALRVEENYKDLKTLTESMRVQHAYRNAPPYSVAPYWEPSRQDWEEAYRRYPDPPK